MEKEKVVLPLKAKHFKSTEFSDHANCAIAKAAKDQFKTELVSEYLTILKVKGDDFNHKKYGESQFDIDKVKAWFLNLFGMKNTVVRRINLVKI